MDDDDSGQDFIANMVLSRVGQDTDVFRNDGSDENSADLNDFFVLEEDASTRLGIEPKKVALYKNQRKTLLYLDYQNKLSKHYLQMTMMVQVTHR